MPTSCSIMANARGDILYSLGLAGVILVGIGTVVVGAVNVVADGVGVPCTSVAVPLGVTSIWAGYNGGIKDPACTGCHIISSPGDGGGSTVVGKDDKGLGGDTIGVKVCVTISC